MNSNSILVIHPYKNHGVWVFDDPETGLVKEPFVAGMPEIIETILRHKVGKGISACTIIFSATPFPQFQGYLSRLQPEHGGTWYSYGDQEGWLCAALFKYFKEAPERIYFQFTERAKTDSEKENPNRFGIPATEFLAKFCATPENQRLYWDSKRRLDLQEMIEMSGEAELYDPQIRHAISANQPPIHEQKDTERTCIYEQDYQT